MASLSEAVGHVVSFLVVDPLFSLLTDTDGLGWARVATAALVWIVLPTAIGMGRLVRDDL